MVRQRGQSIFDAFLLAVVISGLLVAASPLTALAAEPASLQTGQVLPPGFNTCIAPQVQNFITYTYDGSLQAFEFTITDASYVAVIGSVGDISIPFNLMTRRIDAAGLRIHVDTSVPVPTSKPITVTLLSAGGQGVPTCLTIVSATAQGSPVAVHTYTPQPTTAGGSNTGAGATASTSGNSSTNTTSTTGTSTGVVGGGMQNMIKNACSNTSPTRVWVILLAIYAVIAAAATLWEPKRLPTYWTEWITAAIVVPLILLFGFWYLAETCRTGVWVPAIAIIIALAGLSAAFRKHPQVASVIQLPPAQKPPTK